VATIHGKGGMVYLQGSGAAAVKLGEARSWKFNIDKALDEDNALGDTWRTQQVGILSWGGSIEGNVDTADSAAFEAAIATATKALYMYPSAGDTAKYYYGMIWPKIDVEAGLSGVARFTLDFDGDGALGVK
jgi:hypothetical protein